jgi:hypothetical protein
VGLFGDKARLHGSRAHSAGTYCLEARILVETQQNVKAEA